MEYKAALAQVYPYMDLIWIPVFFYVVHRHQRLIALAFLGGCMLMMRLLVELVEGTGYAHGFLGLLQSSLFTRGLAVYSFFYAVYLLIVRFSPGSFRVVLLAASISIFFAASISTIIIMLL